MIHTLKENIEKPRNLMEVNFLLPLLDREENISAIREIIQQLTYVPDIRFYQICIYIHRLIVSGRYSDSISLLIFRPFLTNFIFSNQIHNIQFALKLLIGFGFDIYSSMDEELFLRQMVQTCTLPSLPASYRLLLLAFIKIAFESIFEPPLNSPPLSLLNSLHPNIFDGSDTQEKKLLILNQSSFAVTDDEFFSMLIKLHKKSSSEYRNHKRTTNSLFHILNQTIKKRIQLMDSILLLLLDSFFDSSYIHYVKKFCKFCKDHRDLAQKFTDKFIAKLMMLNKDQHSNQYTISSYQVYSVYLNFINWFLSVAHRNIHLTEFQLEFLINFIYQNSLHYNESSSLALQCCASILYYQRVTNKVKDALLILLEWLKNERKSDLEASSLAQIYLLALRTLAEESIKQVFTSDEEEFLLYQTPEIFEQYLSNVKKTSKECPLVVKFYPLEKINIEKQKFGLPLSKILQFQVSLDKKSKFDKIFCIEIEFSSKQNKNFQRTFQISHLEVDKVPLKIHLPLDFLVKSSILLDISVKFVDFKGNIYNYLQYKNEIIHIEDLMIPLELELSTNIETIQLDALKHCESLQTLICVKKHRTMQSFLNECRWMKKFLLQDDTKSDTINFLMGMAPDRFIIGQIKLINGFINVLITTNYYNIIPSLFFKFQAKIIHS